MLDLSKNIRVALTCTIMSVVLSIILGKKDLYFLSDIVMYILSCIALLSLGWVGFGNFIHNCAAKIGHFLGKYLAIIALFFVYICAVLPTGILMKIVKRDRLLLKQPNTQTYWKKYENTNSDYEYQF